MQRRAFLRGMGSMGATALMSACAHPFQLSHRAMLGTGAGRLEQRDPRGLWREAAAYARWTPSPHNIQPWRLRVHSEQVAELYHDPRRGLPDTDPSSAFMTMSLAMFAEYLSIAVAPRGYQVKAEFVERPLDYTATRPTRFATLTMVPMVDAPQAVAADDRELLLLRQTSRLPYDGNPVDSASMTCIDETAAAVGHRVGWSHEAPLVQDTLDLNRRALFADLNDTVARTELRKWIRPTDAEAVATRDGLWSHCLGYPGWLLRDFFDHHERWARGKRAALCGRLLMRGMRGTRTVAWWSGPFDTPADWIRSGQLLGRQWLELTRRGIYLHPFGSVVTNPAAHAAFLDRLGADMPRERIWLIARMGRSTLPPRSYRLEVPDIFLDAQELT